jgi:hypothetical protein
MSTWIVCEFPPPLALPLFEPPAPAQAVATTLTIAAPAASAAPRQ